MNYWLVKSEPSTYSWEQLVKDKKTTWDGVRNFAARNNLKGMKLGDPVFFYHSNEGLEIVGIAEILKEAYQDPTTDDTNWVAVDIKPVKKMKKAVTLVQIKNNKRLSNIALVRLSRLSVQSVTTDEWMTIIEMGEMK